ncbi:MAG: RagB/SusD family nutrient uptake outer membrane protein [Bacteroidota bacterium]|nr:RagB/SusD family nutrient uptake outer membrane protein [Bacteroidota bacterium]
MRLLKYFIIASILTVASTSCSDFLEEDVYEFITPDNFYKTEADAKAGLTSVYQTLQDGNGFRRYIWMGAEFPGEAAYANASAPSRVEMDDFAWTATTDFSRLIWDISYRGIRRANNLLLNLDKVTFKSEETKNQIIGEAKFNRALNYFVLIRFYDHVAVVTEKDDMNASDLSNEGTDDAVWALMEEDLKYAESVLKVSYGAADMGRATKGAAMALLSKVYLTQATWPWNKAGFYEKAAAKADEIITNETSFGYGLETDFRKIFDVTNEHGKEYMFDVEFVSNINGNDFPALTGMRGYNVKKTDGWSSFISTPKFYKSYAPEDKRIATTFLTGFTDTKTGKVYVYNPDSGTEPSFPLCHFAKYLDPNDNLSTAAGDYGCNMKVVRYADILMVQSEAYCELNQIDKALVGINRVRVRAGLAPLATMSQSDLRKAIIQERVWEFAAEGQAFFDLKRQHAISDRIGKTIADKYYVLPVPQDEIDKNPKLVQHPLWQ